jgi:hypothetical protein
MSKRYRVIKLGIQSETISEYYSVRTDTWEPCTVLEVRTEGIHTKVFIQTLSDTRMWRDALDVRAREVFT